MRYKVLVDYSDKGEELKAGEIVKIEKIFLGHNFEHWAYLDKKILVRDSFLKDYCEKLADE
jgi:hypothetical protein